MDLKTKGYKAVDERFGGLEACGGLDILAGMKRTILLCSVCMVWVTPVWAQDNTIRVVQPDGTVAEAVMPARRAPVVSSAPSPLEAAIQKAVRGMDDAPAAASAEVAPEPASEPVAESVVQPAAVVEEKIEAKAAPVSQPAPAKKKKSAPKPAKKDTANAAQKKYAAAPNAPGRDMDVRPPLDIPQGIEITPEIAKMVALDYAPPARGVEVLPRDYNGKAVYVVRFRTDDGLKDILIDRANGQPIWD
jgi:hypothetical protein